MSLTRRTLPRAQKASRRRRWVARIGVLAVLGALLSLPTSVGATPGTDDYPRRLKIAGQDSLVDPWLFYNRECTSFVAWRLNNDNGVPFHNYYLDVHWGDASHWRDAAVAAGVMVDSTPTRGSVAWWSAGSAGSSRGHVAWVLRASATSVTIEEYNYLSRGQYDTRTIQRSSSLWPSAFIHVGRAAKLRNTSRPSVSGTAQVGQRLEATKGTWSMKGLDFSYQWLADGRPIEGGDHKRLRLKAEQRGAKIQVRVSATKTGQRLVRAASDPTARTARGTFILSDRAAVSGTPQVGQTLSATRGTWTPGGEYTYRWLAAGVPIRGANESTFTPTAGQIDKQIRVQVFASRDGYKRGLTTSPPTEAVVPGTFVNSVRPSIQGVPQVGTELTAVPGTWSPTGRYTYQWFADGVALKATKSTYTPHAPRLGQRITVEVTAKKRGYTTSSATSVASAAVAPGGFLQTRAPAIKGVARVGSPLTADPGTWSPKAHFSYQWLADGVAVHGATGATFTPSPGMLHKAITLQVTARRHGYLTAVVVTESTSNVRLGRIASIERPTVSGNAIYGRTLHATPGTWSVHGVHVSYQWLRDGSAIPGATERRYTTRRVDRGHDVRVQVTVTADGYHSKSKTSTAVAILYGRVEIVDKPTITGDPVVGSRLVAAVDRTKPADGAKVSYQWYRDDRAIGDATKRAYVPVKRDVGSRLYVIVTVAAPDWASSSRRSVPTHMVRPD